MCIRDRYYISLAEKVFPVIEIDAGRTVDVVITQGISLQGCLLYTSDAADERSSVDLGGRRIIKKKTKVYLLKRPTTSILRNDHQQQQRQRVQ